MAEREKIAGIVKMRVVNPKAKHFEEIGHVVGFGGDDFATPLDMEVFILEFLDGDRQRYNIVEIEVVMP